MEGISQDDLSTSHESLGDDNLEDSLPLGEIIKTKDRYGKKKVRERGIISQNSLPDDEMADVIVTELQSWKKTSHRPRRLDKYRLEELAKPKVNHQIMVDRPSVYWTDKIPEDTTLSVTCPIVTPRLEELSRPKRFYSTYYNECRSTPIWPISRASLEAKATPRLKVLAHPKLRSNIWVVDPTKIQVSKAARMAEPRPRTLELAAPKTKTLTSSELFFINKAKQHPPDLTRIYHLAMPKVTSTDYVYDKPPSWIISEETKNAVPTSRILYLAKPRERIDCNEGHDPYCISVAAMKAEPSPRIFELAVPKRVTRKF
ncbi:testicular haploid expressed gene protein [Gracilinanus agilis]|uniref:testicular haploid expressed gene protein n=1 Tax=Gracilinanus agilis TaxID=191870 RepID=UPI001CFD8C0C|nr:testicular haploid expressed gene protein [Gracilinanus agilis]